MSNLESGKWWTRGTHEDTDTYIDRVIPALLSNIIEMRSEIDALLEEEPTPPMGEVVDPLMPEEK